MSIRILKAGISDQVQDCGRFGYQHLGINPNGAMDRYAMQVANMLVGNDPAEAVIEMHFPASGFLFTKAALIAISGADFSPSINGDPVPVNQPIIVAKNDILHFEKPEKGARAYLAVDEGFLLESWLGSYSTNAKAHSGGFKGRSLGKDDEIPFRKTYPFKNPNQFRVLPWKADTGWNDDAEMNEVFVLPGHEWEQLEAESKHGFQNDDFLISTRSDRMGYRLDNNPLIRTTKEELVSSGVGFGTIQLLPDGKLIILGADHQTTGGYPRIAHVISAHLSKLAQMKAGQKMNFRVINQEKAEQLFIKQEIHLQQLKNACSFRLNEFMSK